MTSPLSYTLNDVMLDMQTNMYLIFAALWFSKITDMFLKIIYVYISKWNSIQGDANDNLDK